MKPLVAISALTLLTFACGCATHPPPPAQRTASASEPPPAAPPSPAVTVPPPAAPPTPTATAAPEAPPAATEPPPSVPAECIVGRAKTAPSLSQVLHQRLCQVPQDKWIDPYDPSAFSITPDPSPLTANRGAHADLFVQIENKSARDAILQVETGCTGGVVHFAVYDASGKRIDEVGSEPGMLCERTVVHVLIRPKDGTFLRVPFMARKRSWTDLSIDPKDAGPLPAGTFELRLTLPINGTKPLTLPLEVTR